MLNGLRYPIVQAPMAGVQDEVLTAAVSNSGGLGSLACAMLSLDALKVSLNNLCKLTDKPYNLNFFAHKARPLTAKEKQVWLDTLEPYFAEFNLDSTQLAAGPKRQAFNPDMLKVIAPFKPPVVSFHFGLPDANLILAIKQWGGQVWSTATTVAEAKWLAEHGADAIIAQGLEAGGHRGHFLKSNLDDQLNTLPLLSAIKQVVSIPVIGAGGIVDAQTVNQAITLGASAVQVGTAYLLCDEAKTNDIHRHILQSDDAHHTQITNVFSGRAARGIVNRAIRELGPISENAPSFPHASDAITALRKASEAKGLGDFTPLWCGQNATGCKTVSAKALTEILAKGFNA